MTEPPEPEATDWSDYGKCTRCQQKTGQPCLDLRNQARHRQFFPLARPHPGRPKLHGTGRGTIGGTIRTEIGEKRKKRVDAWATLNQLDDRAAAIRKLLDYALDALMPKPAAAVPGRIASEAAREPSLTAWGRKITLSEDAYTVKLTMPCPVPYKTRIRTTGPVQGEPPVGSEGTVRGGNGAHIWVHFDHGAILPLLVDQDPYEIVVKEDT
ncbi:hypothetical protein [Amycolatopsis sp. NPDC059021]|uniref:hypothetical protein n=1 Tax=Amycolatopsis sp. NPDC059021 TaxID=3346704 RepID=UPI00367355A4